MSLTVLEPGFYTTIQDMGRPGLRHAGLGAGGAMDSYALCVANLLTGNEPQAAGLELTLSGPVLRAEQDMLIALTGADMEPRIVGGMELPMWRPVWLAAGTVFTLGRAAAGCRAYLAVAGGIHVPPQLGGRGTDVRVRIGGLSGRPLAAGDAIPCMAAGDGAPPAVALEARLRQRVLAEGRRQAIAMAAPRWFAPPRAYGGAGADGIVLRAMPGAESGQFSEAARTALYREPFRVAPASDRMGLRLSGPMLERTTRAELLSHGVAPGTVQVPPGGSPIVLAADCQTTGGYPKIAQVAHVDLPLLAQARPGATIRFQPIDLAEAQQLDLAREQELAQLAAGIKAAMSGL
ncbi:biotin-dependent carboxyltransferase family protein [Paenibacillus sp. MAHUQ-46]|uniref:Biotin-dependent carboxyltransferase family protein n=1 Tax=Paenibacillus roseus TaxID=2798579 RepID=A0A934MT55_9BACL|nr:biotin-dependent carboxyltransferase family protein [Paenibacillus roseus]